MIGLVGLLSKTKIKNRDRQFLTGGVTGAEVVTNVLFRGASSL